MAQTGFYSHPDCRLHEMGAGHPESPQRLVAIEEWLAVKGVADVLVWREPRPASTEQLLLGHERKHVATLLGLNEMLNEEQDPDATGYHSIDADTAMNRHTYRAALLSAGMAIQAVDAVLGGELENAFCLTRPPGHHAEHDRAMGFCFFGNVAIAAKYACEHHGLKRVAIVDFDVHHGNGTEDIVAGDERILMVSFYQHPLFPPGGSTHSDPNLANYPVPAYTRGMDIRELVDMLWLPRLDQHRPELILISAGFDAHREDPLGQLQLNENDYAWITGRICDMARKHAQSRVVSCLEGGYNLHALARSVEAHVRVLAGLS